MAPSFENIEFVITDRVARITLARPPLNILKIEMTREIGEVLIQLENRPDLVAIVFDAAPEARAFSAGVAIEEHAAETVHEMLTSFHAIFRGLDKLAKPLIALVDGPALGGGCELIAACDIVLATERARFGQPEIKLGVFPPLAAILLPRIIGEKRARELILTGESIDANEALRLGLINSVVPARELEERTQILLAGLRELSAAGLRFARRALDLGTRSGFESELDEVERLYLDELMTTEDAEEGIQAFLEKRKPRWKNR